MRSSLWNVATLILAAGSLSAPAALAQQFVNGDFETGDLSGWTLDLTFNGKTEHQDAVVVDIDGPGPLPPSYAARFGVGNVNHIQDHQAGIEFHQPLELAGDTVYQVSFNWSVIFSSMSTNQQGGVFSLWVDGRTYATQSAGSVTATTPRYGFLTGEFSTTDPGTYNVGMRLTRPFTYTVPQMLDLHQYVDNFTITPVVGGACCLHDGSCVLATGARCGELDGAYQGDGTLCSGQCPPPGACCVPTGCTVVSQSQCETIQGNYRGNGTNCGSGQCAPPAVTHLVLPAAFETTRGDGWANYPLHRNARQLQVVYDASQLPIAVGSEITGITWRISSHAAQASWPEVPTTYSMYNVQLSTSASPPGSLSVFFDQNVGPDAVMVRSGPLQLAPGAFPGGAVSPAVNDWGYIIPFTTPFVYTGGDLLITIRYSDTGDTPFRTYDHVLSENTAAGYGTLMQALSAGGLAAPNGFIAHAPITLLTFSAGEPCYANCDGSTTEPVLTVDDFTCFINEFAAAQSLPPAQQIEHYANCDGSTTEPVLTVDDFTCFINEFAAGCP